MKRNDTLPASVSMFALLFSLAVSQAAYSQSTRTWVSVNGNDGNDCSRTTPCRTLSGALAKTSAGGEIDVLDSGDFGSVTLNKTISVITPGVLGGIQTGSGTAITVNAGASDKIVLRGLTIDGSGTGGTGISFVAAGALHIENCTINNFNVYGIHFAPNSSSKLYVRDTIITNNGSATTGGGVFIQPTGTGSARAIFNQVNIANNYFGLRADGAVSTGGINITVQGGSASGNTQSGIIAVSGATATWVMVNGTSVSNNGFGVRADGAGALFHLGNTTVAGNGTGMSAINGGTLLSYGNNHVDGNTVDGISPPVVPAQ